MNVQYAVKDDDVYVLEVNPRASRTVPFVSKAIGVPLAKLAALVMAGQDARGARLHPRDQAAPLLGEGSRLPVREVPGRRHAARPRDEEHRRGDGHRLRLRPRLREGADRGGQPAADERARCWSRCATRTTRRIGRVRCASSPQDGFHAAWRRTGTARAPRDAGPARRDGRRRWATGAPDTVDRIEAGESTSSSTPSASDPQASRDSLAMRRAALKRGVPYFTTVAGVRAAAGAIRAMRPSSIGVRSLQEIHPNLAPGGSRERSSVREPRSKRSSRRCASRAAAATSPGRACGTSRPACARRCAARAGAAHPARRRAAIEALRARLRGAARRRVASARGLACGRSRGSRPFAAPEFAERRCARPGLGAPRRRPEARRDARAARARAPSRTCSSTCRRATTTAATWCASASSRSGGRATFAGAGARGRVRAVARRGGRFRRVLPGVVLATRPAASSSSGSAAATRSCRLRHQGPLACS